MPFNNAKSPLKATSSSPEGGFSFFVVPLSLQYSKNSLNFSLYASNPSSMVLKIYLPPKKTISILIPAPHFVKSKNRPPHRAR